VSPNARDRARAKRRYAKRQATLAQRAKARRARQQVTAAVLSILVVVGGVFAVTKWVGSGNDKKPSAAGATSTPTNTPTSTPTGPTCPKATAAKVAKSQQFSKAPDKSLAAGRTWTASVATTCGPMTFELDGAKAPQTVSSFIYLARKGFFNNTTCHRLVTTGIYVLQCGDPTATGNGGPGYGFGIENAPSSGDYPAGTIAMARTNDPNSNGSQFFLVYKDSKLPTDGGGYSIFGTVKSGLDVLTKVAASGAAAADATGNTPPNTPINITSVTVK
jgi:peptidyl-prolyl cis-trans isomerase B (cyclophilin B)